METDRLVNPIMDRTMSNKVDFNKKKFLFSSRYVKNWLEEYSPLWSDQRVLMLFPVVSLPYYEISWIFQIIQIYDKYIRRSNTSVCIWLKILLARSPFPTKGDLIILLGR